MSVVVTWNPCSDPESGIDYYAYGIGIAPGAADLRWWQSTGLATRSYTVSMRELGLHEGDPFFVTVKAVNGANLSSALVPTGPLAFHWEALGNPANELVIAYADSGFDKTGTNVIAGWDSTQIATFDHFLSRMNPIIKEIYGPPSHPYTMTLVKNLYYSGSNVFMPSSNEIHMASFYPQLLTHELLHAYRDNVVLAEDLNWHYHPRLSGFEEGFAQGVSYACMNRYVELYPADAIVDSTYIFGSSNDWDYDYQNVSAITTEDLWSDAGGTLIYWYRYELAAAAVRKMQLEDPFFVKAFNAEYYARLNADHALTPTRPLVVDICATLLPEVEGLPTPAWIDGQRIFDCRIQTGPKIWVRTQQYPTGHDYYSFQRIHYYETFPNGSDWAYWSGNQWVLHHLNGTPGTGRVLTDGGGLVWQGNLLMEPVDNPPVFYGFGSDVKNFSTDDDTQPWPGDDPDDYVLGMTGNSLYRFEITFDATTTNIYRVMGEKMTHGAGIYGGVRNADGGMILIDHEGYPNEPPLPVVDGFFQGTRAWASVPNPQTGGTDSKPGRVFIQYVTQSGDRYRARRNIDLGSQMGNQVFLFDRLEMTPDTTVLAVGTPLGGREWPGFGSRNTQSVPGVDDHSVFFGPADARGPARV